MSAHAARRPRLLYAVTDPMTADILLRGQLAWMRSRGFDIGLVAAPGPGLERAAAREGVVARAVPMVREIAPMRDAVSLFGLLSAIRGFAPDIVHASTPKAALLATIAAAALRVPVRVYWVRGLRLESTGGWLRRLLAAAERLTCRLATDVICNSASLAEEVRRLRLAGRNRPRVLGAGSSNGVNVERFRPPRDRAEVRDIRREAGLPPDVPVVGYVGRMTLDKGIGDLLQAFENLVLPRFPRARLLAVGGVEEGDPVPLAVRERLESAPWAHLTGFVEDTARWMRAMDVLAFPSRREGFPNAPLEAAATAVPTVAYTATGTVDAVLDGATGSLVAAGDWASLGQELMRYLSDEGLRASRGERARQRAVDEFRDVAVWRVWADECTRLLGQRGRRTTPSDENPWETP